MHQAVTWGGFFCLLSLLAAETKIRRRKALWKLTELWKNPKTVFPQLLEPAVHSSHNAGCCWSFLKHNFSSTPPTRERQAGPCGVAERAVVPKKQGNSGGGKRPQLKTDARSNEGHGELTKTVATPSCVQKL